MPSVTRAVSATSAFFLTLLGLAGLSSGPQAPDSKGMLCHPAALQLQSPGGFGRIAFAQPMFASSRTSWASLSLAGILSSSICRIAVVIEFLDQDNQPILSLPLRASTGCSNDVKLWPFTSDEIQDLARVPANDGTIQLWTHSSLSSCQCPSRARITYYSIVLVDGTVDSWASPGWHTPAVLAEAPDFYETTGHESHAQTEIDVAVQIDSQGGVTGAQETPELTPDEDAQFQIISNVRKWRFTPALRDGSPVSSVLPVRFQFHISENKANNDWYLSKPIADWHSFVVADLYPHRAQEGKWVLIYAGNYGGPGPKSHLMRKEDMPF